MQAPRLYTLRFLKTAAAVLLRFTAGHCCPVIVQVAALILADYLNRSHLPPRLDGRQLATRARRADELAELAATLAELVD